MKPCNFIALCLITSILVSSCISRSRQINWSISLDKKDKKPYGSYLAHESLKLLFPAAKVTDLSKGFKYNGIDDKMIHPTKGPSMIIAVGLDFYMSQSELKKLIAFAAAGNELVIFSRLIDSKLETYLGAYIQDNGTEEAPLSTYNTGKANIDAITVISHQAKFGYQGRSILGSFSVNPNQGNVIDTDSANGGMHIEERPGLSDTLGFARQKPNFLRFKVGAGHILVHAAPLVMSNYFLLQNHNRSYIEAVFGFIPDKIKSIYWHDFYKRDSRASDLSILMRYPATKWALIIAAFSLLVYVLFESKRRQNIIPEIQPPENSTVSFVETIGRLYYNKGDHTNLAEKMAQHFLEWVRSHYFISTAQLDERFINQLTVRSGMPEATVRSLIELIQETHTGQKALDEVDLFHLHTTMQQFYTNYTKYGNRNRSN